MKLLLFLCFSLIVFVQSSEDYFLERISPITQTLYKNTKNSLHNLKLNYLSGNLTLTEFSKQSKDIIRQFKKYCFSKKIKKEIFLGLVNPLRLILHVSSSKNSQPNSNGKNSEQIPLENPKAPSTTKSKLIYLVSVSFFILWFSCCGLQVLNLFLIFPIAIITFILHGFYLTLAQVFIILIFSCFK